MSLTDRQIIDHAYEIGIKYVLLDRENGWIDCPGATDRQLDRLFVWLVEQGEALSEC